MGVPGRRGGKGDEEGGALYGVDVEGDIARLTFGRGGVDPRRVRKGDLVWCTSDVALTKQLQTMAKEGRESVGGRTVAARAAGEVGAPLRVEYTCRATGVTGAAATGAAATGTAGAVDAAGAAGATGVAGVAGVAGASVFNCEARRQGAGRRALVRARRRRVCEGAGRTRRR